MHTINETEFQQHLYGLFEQMTMPDSDEIMVPRELIAESTGIDWVKTFKEADLLTRDAGIILRMQDGSKFLISIMQTR